MTLTFAEPDDTARPLFAVTKEEFDRWMTGQDAATREWIEANGFQPDIGKVLVLPGGSGIQGAICGLGDHQARLRGRFGLAAARGALPAGTWSLKCDLTGDELHQAALGWLLAGYNFDKYAKSTGPKAQLIAPDGVDAARIEAIATGEYLTRDLINTPASDMGPDELEAAAKDLAETFDAAVSVISGEALLEKNFPMIHAVGRASPRAPRLIDMTWGNAGPCLTLVGKGVCFDTGGLNLKPGASMGLMKKDMGGAATVLGLAYMIMAMDLPMRLRVLIPAVENSVSGNAFRPQDILTSRKGLTVEINNTDAEGRLVLADALALADEDKPDLVISMATLTGAARVAVGPDLAAYFSQRDEDAQTLEAAAARVADPTWRLPFHDPYETMIEPGIADLDNAPKGGFGGAITAALFLRRFVTDTPRFMHFDIYGWNPTAKPGRSKGGTGQGARALFDALPGLLNL